MKVLVVGGLGFLGKNILKKFFHNKKYELYVVSRVLFSLNDPEIEFICQQYVKTPKGRNFVDLYFPQFQLYLKVNEDYHGTEKQKENILYKPGDRFIVNEKGWLIRMNPEDIEARKAQET